MEWASAALPDLKTKTRECWKFYRFGLPGQQSVAEGGK
jgi:hypothetical protein